MKNAPVRKFSVGKKKKKRKDEYKDFQLEEQKQVVSQNPITPDGMAVKYRENQSELESA